MKLHVGICFLKGSFEVNLNGQNDVRKFIYNDQEINECIELLSVEPIEFVVVEACGGYELKLAFRIQQAGLSIAIVNSKRVRKFSRSLGLLTRPYRIDAKVVSAFASTLNTPKFATIDMDASELKALVARRNQLVEIRVSESRRKERVLDIGIAESIEAVIRTMEKEIAKVEKQIADHIDHPPNLRQKSKKFQLKSEYALTGESRK